MNIVTLLVFSVCLLSYLAICLLLLTVKRTNLQSKLLFAALATSTGWALGGVVGVVLNMPLAYYSTLDCLRWLGWALFLVSALSGKKQFAEFSRLSDRQRVIPCPTGVGGRDNI
jgi:hypothetical protein